MFRLIKKWLMEDSPMQRWCQYMENTLSRKIL